MEIVQKISKFWEDEKEKKKVKETIKEIAEISFPTCFFFLCINLLQTINLSFVSRKYKDYELVSGIGLSHLYINCTTLSVSVGLISGLECLASNAYGAKQYYLMGLYIHRGRLITYTYLFIIGIFNYYYAMDILSIFNIDANAMYYCASYINKNLFMMIFEIHFHINFRHIAIMGKSYINGIVMLIAILMHPIWCYIYITQLDMGVIGAAYAIITSMMFSAGATSYYLHFYNPVPESYFWINKDCFRGWESYLHIAIPSMLSMVGCWVGYEIQAFIAVCMGSFEYSVQVIISNLENVTFTLTLGFSNGIAIKSAEKIVSTDKKTFSDFCKISYFFNLFCVCLLAIFLFLFRHFIISLLSANDNVYNEALPCMVWLCLFRLVDNGAFFFTGLFRGMAYLKIPTTLTFINLFLIQTSFSYLLGIRLGFGVKGIWISLFIGSFLLCLAFAYILQHYVDVDVFKQEAHDRMDREKKMIEHTIHEDAVVVEDRLNYTQNYEMMEVKE